MSKTYLRRNKIAGQFSARTIEMMEAPAFQVLSLSAHRVLNRLEIEHAHHAGNDNGKLPVTFNQFGECGIDRHAIAPALREVCALGFVEITEHGQARNREFRRPNLFRLTYRDFGRAAATNEWRNIKTMEQAEYIACAARKLTEPARTKKQNSSGGKNHFSVGKTHTETTQVSVGETHTTGQGGKTPTTSISRNQAQRGSSSVEGSAKLVWSTPTLIEVTDLDEALPLSTAHPMLAPPDSTSSP
jgi:hypothetical protein